MNDKAEMQRSEYIKLIDMFHIYEKILHPDIFFPILRQMNAAWEEVKVEAYREAKISDEALQIEKMMADLRNKFERFPDTEAKTFHIKCFYKELLKTFLK